jgi:hypothetical protein
MTGSGARSQLATTVEVAGPVNHVGKHPRGCDDRDFDANEVRMTVGVTGTVGLTGRASTEAAAAAR